MRNEPNFHESGTSHNIKFQAKKTTEFNVNGYAQSGIKHKMTVVLVFTLFGKNMYRSGHGALFSLQQAES